VALNHQHALFPRLAFFSSSGCVDICDRHHSFFIVIIIVVVSVVVNIGVIVWCSS